MTKSSRFLPRIAFFLAFKLALAVSAYASNHPEYRALWVSAWDPGPTAESGLHTPGEIDNLLEFAQQGNFNMIIPQVRRRGDAFYDSTIEPKNPEISPTFDPLAYLIQRAHALNPPIEVHAWVVVYPIGSSSHPDHVFTKHPDWLMETAAGETLIGSNIWVDPAHPGVQEHTLNVALDLVSRYDIDGLHYDYIRYPNRNSGYNPVSVARFNQRFGRTGTPNSDDSAWLQFRRDAISELVRRIYLETISLRPDIQISAATIGFAPGITTTSQWTGSSAFAHNLQDWRAWMEEGILDINLPMLYFRQQENKEAWERWNIFAKNHRYNRHLAIGVGTYLNSIPDGMEQLLHTREATSAGNRADGSVVYHYYRPSASGTRTQFRNALTSQVYTGKVAIPDMPWKSNPTRGHLKGFVTASNTGKGFDGAIVSLTGPRSLTRRTDPHGFHGAVDLPPGTYTVTASMPNAPYANASAQVTIVAGEVATLDLELEFSPAEDIIIDHPGATLSGSWSTSSFGSPYGTNYRTAVTVTGAASATATYRPTIDTPGLYDVYAWWVELFDRTPDARHQILGTDGGQTVSVDQTQPGSGWVRLAEGIHFSQGTDGYVRIVNSSNTADARVVAGAVRFILVEPDPDPEEYFDEPIVYPSMQGATIVTSTMEPARVRIEYGISQLTTTLSPETPNAADIQSVTIGGLEPRTQYQFRVHARVGNRQYSSNWFSFQTLDPIILDNLDSGVTFSGSWSTAAFGSLYYGENYHRSFDNNVGATATFRPNLPATGTYDVYTWYPSGDGFASSAPHIIQFDGGQTTVPVDQRTNGGGWRLLASELPFAAGTSGFVRIVNDGSGHTMADAQRWVLRETTITHTLQTVISGEGSVGRSPSGSTYTHGTTVALTPNPSEGWVFSHWEGDVESDSNPLSVTLYTDLEITGVFQPLLQLTTEVTGQGTIVVEPEGDLHPADSDVVVTAVPAEGYEFTGWSGSISGFDNPFHVWMDEDKHVVAIFEAIGETFDNWVAAHFDEEEQADETISGPTADPGNFGIPNLLRYAFGLEPREPDATLLPTVANPNGRLTISFRRLAGQTDLQYRIDVASHLNDGWAPGDDQFEVISVEEEENGAVERVVLEDKEENGANARRFVRIRVVREG